MANTTIFDYKDVKNQPHRSAFDLSKRLLFTSKVGELLPVYCKPTMPGDRWNINLQSFTRTQTVQSSAFTRIKEYVDFFYVPYHLLWRNFQASFTQISQSTNFASSPIKDIPICDKLPYISQRKIFQYLYDNISTANFGDEVGAAYYQQIFKLLAYLGYYDLTSSTRNTFKDSWSAIKNNIPDKNVSLMPLLAYQKVYYDFYRNDRWEVNKPTAFNVDYMIDSTNYADFVTNSKDILDSGMLNLHYANYAKDLFLGLLPSAQYGDTSVVTTSVTGSYTLRPDDIVLSGNVIDKDGHLVRSINVIDSNKISSTTGDKYFPVGTSEVSPLSVFVSNDNAISGAINNASSQLDVLKLRQANALQKWREITQCGDFNYRSQVEKHFGVKLPELMAHRCTYLGGTQGVITINEVVNQNLIGNNEAEIKGKGVGGFNDGNINFECKDHGLIMGIYYAIPYVDYKISGLRRDLTTVNISDLPIPEFDRLGFESFDVDEMFNLSSGGLSTFVGYAPRYYSYKTDVDEVKGAFTTSLPNWVAQYDSEYARNLVSTKNLNTAIKVNASILDDIFAVNAWIPNETDIQINTDQLLNCINFEVHAVRNLDYSGVPY